MLNYERITIGKLKQAYRLNAQEADVLISILASRGCVDLYELWHEAVRFVAAEESNKKSIYVEVAEPHFPSVSDLGQDLLQQRIATKRLLRHFLFSARGGKPREYLQKIFNRVLHFTYDDPDEQLVVLVNRILDMIYEQRHFGFRGIDKVDIAWEYVSPELFAEFCSLFDDAISSNKEVAVLQLFEQGYSWERSVKGLSRELVERILATAATTTSQAQAAPANSSSPPFLTSVIVPRALWQGKEHTAAFEALRENKYSDEVIAHVLFEWCDLKNKTEIGRLLSDSEQEASTYLHRVNRLLKKAAARAIISD